MNRSYCKPWPHSAGILARLQASKLAPWRRAEADAWPAKGPWWRASDGFAREAGPASNLDARRGAFRRGFTHSGCPAHSNGG